MNNYEYIRLLGRLDSAIERENNPDFKLKLLRIRLGSTYGGIDRKNPVGNRSRSYAKEERNAVLNLYLEQTRPEHSED